MSSSLTQTALLSHRYNSHNASLHTQSTGHRLDQKDSKEVFVVYDRFNHVYSCASCGKKYKSPAGARLHYRIKHCGFFDHYCSMCGKGFQQKSHLKSHMSLHMQQKDFECNLCGSKYAHKTSLTAHQKIAHGAFT